MKLGEMSPSSALVRGMPWRDATRKTTGRSDPESGPEGNPGRCAEPLRGRGRKSGPPRPPKDHPIVVGTRRSPSRPSPRDPWRSGLGADGPLTGSLGRFPIQSRPASYSSLGGRFHVVSFASPRRAARLHPDRAAGRHRDHRRPDRPARCPPCRRPARPPAAPSASTTSSSSAWRRTTTSTSTRPSRWAGFFGRATVRRHPVDARSLLRLIRRSSSRGIFTTRSIRIIRYYDPSNPANFTVHGAKLATLFCPSDPTVAEGSAGYTGRLGSGMPGYTAGLTSYRAISGPWVNPPGVGRRTRPTDPATGRATEELAMPWA